jgi:PAS domain S-box-containing protein
MAVKISLYYALLSAIWIFCSGWLLHHFVQDPFWVTWIEYCKGWFFVLGTAFLLGLVLDRLFWKNRDSVQQIQDSEATMLRLNRELRAISDCNKALIRATDEQTLLNDICRLICGETGYRLAWVGYAENDAAKSVRPVACAGAEEGYLANLGITWADTERGWSPTGTAIRSGQSCCIQDFATDPRFAPWRESALQHGFLSGIALPLKDGHAHAFGSLSIYSDQPNAFTSEEFRLLEELAADLAFGIVTMRSQAARKQAEQEVALLGFALDKVREAAFLIDDRGRVNNVNEEACRVLGFSRAEMLGLAVADIDPEFPAERWPDHWRNLTAHRSLNFESLHRTRDGRTFPVEISANYFEYGGRAYDLALVRDITERKKADQELQRSKAYLAEAQTLSKTGSWAYDPNTGRIVYWSEEQFRITGFDPQEGPPDLEKLWQRIHPEDRQRAEERRVKGFRDKAGYVQDYRVVLPDGTIKHLHVIGHPVLTEAGEVLEFIGTSVDVTERKRVEETLRLASAYNRSLIEASLDPLVTIDKHGQISDVNAATEQMTGYTREQLIGTDFSNYFTEPEKARAGYQQAFDQGFVRDYELEIGNRNGEITPVLYNASVYRDDTGNVVGVFAAARDITKQKRTEEARSRLAAIVESSDDAIISKDLNGTIMSWNDGAQRLYGYSAAEALGRPVSILMLPDQQDQMAVLARQIREGIKVEHYETERVRKDGRRIYVSLTLSPVRNRQGEIIGASTIARDVTERKQVQDALRNLMAELELRVKARTKELSEANKSLLAVNRELESFSYSVSHDLRAPLRAIDGFSKMLLKDYADKLDEDGRRKLNVIRSNTQNMGQLIEDLLAFSRVGRKEIVSASLDMEGLVRAAWKEISLLKPERRPKLALDKLPQSIGDHALIKQVIVNLLSNAIKYSRSRESALVEVGAYPEGERNVYFVRDNGAGFDMDYYHKLFGVFQRLHSTDEFEGTGVGLAIVERIIRRHGGNVWAEGKVGEGATFYFTLASKE